MTTTDTEKTPRWEKGIRLEKGGHRVFRDASKPFRAPELRDWAIADNSGTTPERTDDGILWLDFSRPLEVHIEAEFSKVSIPLCGDRWSADRESRTGTGIEGLATLRRLFPHWALKLSPATQLVLDVLGEDRAREAVREALALRDAALDNREAAIREAHQAIVERDQARAHTSTAAFMRIERERDQARAERDQALATLRTIADAAALAAKGGV